MGSFPDAPEAPGVHRGGMSPTTNTLSDPKIQAVRRLYAAYGRGDIDAVLAELAEDVDWAAEAGGTAVPWWGPFRGRADVARFFKEIGAHVDVTEFDLASLTCNDRDVVAIVHWTFTVKATGKTASMYMQHWWRFADGKVVLFRGSEDTAQSAEVFS
jgi:ketosteroid isomerase-like protein